MRVGLAFQTAVAVIALLTLMSCTPIQAQVRGVYPVGMNATNAGVTPEAGITYSNLFVFFSRDEDRGPNGEVIATGQNSIMMDLNSFVWVSKKELAPLGGAVFSGSPGDFDKLIADETEKWARVVKFSGAKPD